MGNENKIASNESFWCSDTQGVYPSEFGFRSTQRYIEIFWIAFGLNLL